MSSAENSPKSDQKSLYIQVLILGSLCLFLGALAALLLSSSPTTQIPRAESVPTAMEISLYYLTEESLQANPPKKVGLRESLPKGGIVNYWASWCLPCALEHPVLMELKEQGVDITGVAYADDRAAALKFLADRGNPFAHSLRDDGGATDFYLGVVGLPTTFIVDDQGNIIEMIEGVLTIDKLSEQSLALLRESENLLN